MAIAKRTETDKLPWNALGNQVSIKDEPPDPEDSQNSFG